MLLAPFFLFVFTVCTHILIIGCIQSLDWTSGLDSCARCYSDAAITLAIAGVMYFADSWAELEIAVNNNPDVLLFLYQ